MEPIRHRLRWALKYSLVALVISGATLTWLLRDEPPPDVSDIQPRTRILPDSENALLALRTLAAEREPATKDDAYQSALDRLTENPDYWKESDVKTIVETRADLWPRFDEILRMPKAESPLPVSSIDFPNYRMSDTLSLWKAACIRAQFIAKTQSPDEGLEKALALLEHSRIQTNSAGVMIDYLVSAALRGKALQCMRWIVANTAPSEHALRAALNKLGEARPDAGQLAETFRAEHAFGMIAISELAENIPKSANLGMHETTPFCVTWFYKPNKTLRLMSDQCRASSAAIGWPLAKMRSLLPESDPKAAIIGRIPNPDNALGRYAIGMLGDAHRGILKTWLRDQTTLSATQAWLAAIIYKSEHGEFPPSLDTLVPAYLIAPRDYLTGLPIRYSRELEVIWAVGDNQLNITNADQVVETREIAFYLTPSRTLPTDAIRDSVD